MSFHRSYRFRIYPNNTQIKKIAVCFGQARFVWNYSLSLRSDLYDFRKERINYVGLDKHLTYLKGQESHKWLKECPSEVLTQTLIDQDKALKSFFAGRSKYPRFKKKVARQSIRFKLDQRYIDFNYKSGELLKLTRIGAIKVNWSRLPSGTPKMATISRDACGKYWVSFSCEESIQPKEKTNRSVGVDIGIKDVLVTSDGYHSGAPKNTYRYARSLKLAQRKLSRKTKGSARWEKQRKAVARIHKRISDSRSDFINKLSHKLVSEYDLINMEDLNVKGMMANRRLSKAVADVGMFELRRQVEYKSEWYGKRCQLISRWFPSSKMCSACGAINSNLKLSDRSWDCACGANHNRDKNAAINIDAEGNRLSLNCVELDTNCEAIWQAQQAVKRGPSSIKLDVYTGFPIQKVFNLPVALEYEKTLTRLEQDVLDDRRSRMSESSLVDGKYSGVGE